MLAGFDQDEFLSVYWQKKSCLLHNMFQTDINIGGNELAGLSLEPAVESRVVIKENDNWQLINGPFDEAFYSNPPETPWTLLIQAVNQYLPEFSAILDDFNFIPAWRMDDIMASYAVQGAGVGPHFDYYDVFLIQYSGEREWLLGDFCDETDRLRTGTELKILEHMQSRDRHHLKPGDILYVPAKQAHWGTALSDDCLTFSVGFRAPSYQQIISELPHYLSKSVSASLFYQNANDTKARASTAQLLKQDVEQLRDTLRLINEATDEKLAEWLGAFMTETKYPDLQDLHKPEYTIAELLQMNVTLRRDESVRIAYFKPDEQMVQAAEQGSKNQEHAKDDVVQSQQDNQNVNATANNNGMLFVNGSAIAFNIQQLKLVTYLCDNRELNINILRQFLDSKANQDWFNDIYMSGYWYVIA